MTAHLDIFGDAFEIFVDKIKVSINTRLFDDTEKFEIAIRTAEALQIGPRKKKCRENNSLIFCIND